MPSFQFCLQSRICILLWAPFHFPDVSYSLLCSSRGSKEASGHIPEQGNALNLTMLQCTAQQLLNLLTAEAEHTWPRSLQKQRVHNAPAAHTREPVQVCSHSHHISMTGQRKMGHREQIDRRDHDRDVQSAQCKKKPLSFRFCLSPCFHNKLLKCPFFQP